jgi:plasmid stabilization system protein ParE
MKSRRFELSASARLDLLQIWNYLAEQASVDVADRVARHIEIGIGKIVRSQKLGHSRPDLTDRNLRFYLVHSYLIIYRPDTSPLQIARVLHAARDVRTLLGE